MSNTLVRRSSKVALVLVVTLVVGTLGALPAFATAATTAFVNVHNVLAGQAGKVFTIRVNNTESTGIVGGIGASTKTIKEVRIMPPPDLIDAVLPGSSGPGQFTDIRVVGSPPAEIRFRVPGAGPGVNPQPEGGLAPGANATFTIAADVRNTLLQDGWENWRIRVSSDMVNYTASTPTGENLRTDIRVLQVQNVAVLAPTGAADDRDGDGKPEVTGTQSNICVRSRVRNAAATALNVTPGLSGGNVTVGQPRTAATPPCSGAVLSGGSGSVAGNSFRDFDFLVTADDVNSLSSSELTGTASAPGASTPATSDPDDDIFQAAQALNIEPRATFNYVGASLNPRAVVPDLDTDLEETFTLRVNKGPAGSPPLPTVNGSFNSAFCDTQPGVAGIQAPGMTAPPNFAGGAASNQTITYAACDIAALADGRYSVDPKIGYTDGNGLVQAATSITGVEQVRLDSLIPSVDVNITDPPVQVTAVPPVEPAVTSGTAFTATGNVTDTDPTTGQQVACGPNPAGSTAPLPCTLEVAELIQYPLTAAQGGGNPNLFPRIPVKSSCSLSSGGSLSCNLNVQFAAGVGSDGVSRVQSTALYVEVKDETGNIGKDPSLDLIDVDIINPFIKSATTQRGGSISVGTQQVPGQRRTVVVQFNEPVQIGNGQSQGSPGDWIVQDGSAKTVCSVTQSADKRTVTLTTCQELNADATGTVDYNPRAPISSPYHDRVGKEVAAGTTPLTDGIGPLTPSISEVEDKPLQDGAFYFNTPTPKVELIETSPPASDEDHAINAGYTIELYEDTDGTAGLNRLTDRQICGEGVTTVAAATLTGCDFSGVDRQSDVFALSIDGNTNVGDASTADFVLDRLRPVFQGLATLSGTTITVNLSEEICQLAGHGTATAGNWLYSTRRISDNQRVFPEVTADDTGATAKQRELTFNYGEHSAATLRSEAVMYRFDNGARLQDRAGNELLDGDQLFQ